MAEVDRAPLGPQHRAFGALLKEARERAQLSQGELGKLIGYSGAQISRIEAGLRTLRLDHLGRLADVLDIDLNVLRVMFPPQSPEDTSDPDTAPTVEGAAPALVKGVA